MLLFRVPVQRHVLTGKFQVTPPSTHQLILLPRSHSFLCAPKLQQQTLAAIFVGVELTQVSSYTNSVADLHRGGSRNVEEGGARFLVLGVVFTEIRKIP